MTEIILARHGETQWNVEEVFRGRIDIGLNENGIKQAELLDSIIEELGREISAILLVQASEETVIERLSGRRQCRKCSHIYHVKNIPSKVEGVCDECGGELYHRDDDKEEVVRDRLEVYKKQTEPLIEFYRNKNIMVDIKVIGGPDIMVPKILEAIKAE